MKRKWIDVYALIKIEASKEEIYMFLAMYGKNRVPITDVIKDYISHGSPYALKYANWAVVGGMTRRQYVSYAVFAAEEVINIFENRDPSDLRPRQAIEAAKQCISGYAKANIRAAARAASAAARAVADKHTVAASFDALASDDAAAGYAAYAAAYAADCCASKVIHVAEYAARAAEAVAFAAACDNTTMALYRAYSVARRNMYTKILKNGIKLLETQEK